MNTPLPFLLFIAIACRADDTTGLTNKVTETNDGKDRIRLERVYRGKAEVMQIMSRGTTNREMAVVTRSILAACELRMGESDEDGDGFLETIILHAPAAKDIEVFKRQRDGSVRPVSTPVLEVWKKMEATQADIGRMMRDGIEGKTKPDAVREEVQRIRQKLERLHQDLERLETKEKR
jgi:hypothetical protein